MTPASLPNYWNTLYAQQRLEQTPWFQPNAAAALRLFAQAALPFDAPVIDVGAGLSPFLDGLLAQGYTNLIAADLSAVALDRYRCQLPPELAERVLAVVDDVTAPQHLSLLDPVLLWHDRGLLHGLLSTGQTAAYGRLLDHMVLAHGWVLLGVRTPQPGPPPTEAGLLVQPYDVAGLAAFLGTHYALRHAFEEVHETPQGDRHGYTYALFQRDTTARTGPWH